MVATQWHETIGKMAGQVRSSYFPPPILLSHMTMQSQENYGAGSRGPSNRSNKGPQKTQPITKNVRPKATLALSEKQHRKQNKRALQQAAMKKKADSEMMYFRKCRAQKRQQRHEATEAEVFGTPSVKGINFAKYDDIHVEVRRGNKSETLSFHDFGALSLIPQLLRNVSLMGYASPTPIQKHSIPLALAGDDLMCCAQTGSGKTCAFLLPIVRSLKEDAPINAAKSSGPVSPRCVILAPTRELAIQTEKESQKLCFSLEDLWPVAVYGGANARSQLKGLAEGADIVVATPGRLTDFVDRKIVSLAKVKFLVLDEADRMMDMGFEPQMRRLILESGMTNKEKRQTLMFSATFDAPMQKMAAKFLRSTYTWIAVGRVGSTTESITQKIVKATEIKREKLALVVQAIEKGPPGRTIIFVRKKSSATWLKKMLNNGGPADGDRFTRIPSADIHGDRSQSQRESALNNFRDGSCRVLVATDVAARGLDIAGVEHVINMDMPADAEFDSYTHRIGRTGRNGHVGVATSLFVPADNGKSAKPLVKQLREAKQDVPRWLEQLAGGGSIHKAVGGGRPSQGSDGRRRKRN